MTLLYAAMEDALVVAAGEGDDWTSATTLRGRDLECVAAAPEEPHRVFVGTFSSGLWRSEDGGETFGRVAQSTVTDPVTAVAVNPRDPDEVWAGTEPSKLYRSTDGGDTWGSGVDLSALPTAGEWSFPPRPDTHHVRWVEVDPSDPDRLLVGVEAGALLLSEDRGETWHERPEGARRDNHQLATHPDAPERVYAAAGDGFAASYDGGRTWEHPQRGLDHRYVWSVAVGPANPDTVLVSAASGAHRAHSTDGADSYVYRWTDPGPDGDPAEASWTPLDDRGLPTGRGVLRAVLAGGDAPGEFYAVNNHGVYRTTTRGTEWTALPVGGPYEFAGTTCRGLAVV